MDEKYCWEDKYHNVRAERNELSKKCHAQEQSIRVLRARYAKLESRMQLMNRNNSHHRGNSNDIDSHHKTIAFGGKLYSDDNDLTLTSTENSNQSYVKLEQRYQRLLTKHKSAMKAITNYKKEIASLRRRLQTVIPLRITNQSNKIQTQKRKVQENVETSQLFEENKQRLNQVEKQLRWMREENNELRNKLVDFNEKEGVERERINIEVSLKVLLT